MGLMVVVNAVDLILHSPFFKIASGTQLTLPLWQKAKKN